MLARSVLLQMAGNKKLESFMRHNGFASRLARQFIAGETIDDVTLSVRGLNALGMHSSLDFLGESVTSEQEVAVVVDTYLRLFQRIRMENLDANVSVKLTSLGMDLGPDLALRNLQRLLDAAGPDQFVRVDMEGSPYTQATLDLFFKLWNAPRSLHNTGVVIQSYLKRSAADIEHLIQQGVRVRLCKGAYKEPAEIAYQEKKEVDASYLRLMERLLSEGNYPGIATHDLRMIDATKKFAGDHSIPQTRFEFQMLYGVRRELQEQLVREGYNMRVYTPFGSHWYPYMMRRMAERPANLWFAVNSILRR